MVARRVGCEETQARPAICGVVVRPPSVSRYFAGRPRGLAKAGCPDGRTIVVPATNSILIGPVPGEIAACIPRNDINAELSIGFPWFEPVWAIPADALSSDKQIARVLLVGSPRPVVNLAKETRRKAEEEARPADKNWKRLLAKLLLRDGLEKECEREVVELALAWCAAVRSAGMKGLMTKPSQAEIAQLWQAYKRQAKMIWKRLR